MLQGTTACLLTYGASLLGYAAGYPYSGFLKSRVESRHENANIIQLNEDKVSENYRPTRRVQHLAGYTVSSSACSACYGNLIHALAGLTSRALRRLKSKVHIGDFRGKAEEE